MKLDVESDDKRSTPEQTTATLRAVLRHVRRAHVQT